MDSSNLGGTGITGGGSPISTVFPIFLSQPGRKKSVLTQFTWNHVSSDGYYASKLNKSLRFEMDKKSQNMVVIGHPKGNTLFSVKALDSFVKKNYLTHNFTSFCQLK